MKYYRVITGLFFLLFAVQYVIAEKGIDGKLLLRMSEEERMSYDLYTEYYERWSLDVFDNVRESEFIHLQRIQELLVKYNVESQPEENVNEKGIYSNKDIQKIYDEFTVKGCISDICALNAAAYMEEKDIADLRERIKDQSDEYIIKIFTQMEKATENHLKAFVKKLKLTGVEYLPQVLSEQEYKNIIYSVKDKGTAISR